MSELWSIRQRNTNRLVRLVAPKVLNSEKISADQLYGLCKLTWITDNHFATKAPYINSTKIPALGNIFHKDFTGYTLNEVALYAAEFLGDPSAVEIIKEHTGFTNLYKAYRNSSRAWISKNASELSKLFTKAFNLLDDDQGLELTEALALLPGIPKPGNPNNEMRPEYLLTPVFFALDERKRFPIINGNKNVKNLFKALGIANSSIQTQYSQMIGIYGQGGIRDAADLDQAGPDLPSLISAPNLTPTKQLLDEKATEGNQLPLKDENDINSIISAKTIISKRLHNLLTNKLRKTLSNFTLYEGPSGKIMFDAMVKSYDGSNTDLLIEVKSSCEVAHIRMAVGQLYSYSYFLNSNSENHLAVLLPERPSTQVVNWLTWLDIGLLWFSDDSLHTTSQWLDCIAEIQ